jgi:hypothetical protein
LGFGFALESNVSDLVLEQVRPAGRVELRLTESIGAELGGDAPLPAASIAANGARAELKQCRQL